jgi:mannose-6-phosphate isomerase
MAIPVFKVIPSAQQYDWGKVGSQSRVAQLVGATGASIQEDKPYAEAITYVFRATFC